MGKSLAYRRQNLRPSQRPAKQVIDKAAVVIGQLGQREAHFVSDGPPGRQNARKGQLVEGVGVAERSGWKRGRILLNADHHHIVFAAQRRTRELELRRQLSDLVGANLATTLAMLSIAMKGDRATDRGVGSEALLALFDE